MERTMSEMALGIADGIRNPLLIIGGFSHRLLKKTAPDDPARDWATAIADEAKRLEQMVGNFEALAEKKEAFFGQENLNTLVGRYPGDPAAGDGKERYSPGQWFLSLSHRRPPE